MTISKNQIDKISSSARAVAIMMAIFVYSCSMAQTQPSNKTEPSHDLMQSSTHTQPTSPNSLTSENSQNSPDILILLRSIQERLQNLEIKISNLSDKIDARFDSVKTTAVIGHPSDSIGVLTKTPPAASDPEGGFINDDAVQSFRKANILYLGQKYSEAILAFSVFLEKYPDHALAGSAQFFIGESYMKQKEYKLALKELQRVLTSYDRSTHVTDTLREISIAHETLKNQTESVRFTQLLTSIFPQSPAAHQMVSQINTSSESTPHTSSEPNIDSAEIPPQTPSSPPPPPTAPWTNKESSDQKP